MGAAPSRTKDSRIVATMAPSADTTNQAESKRALAPYMFREIVADEKVSDAAALQDHVSTGILLAGKTKVRIPLKSEHELP
jgi:hypothetical protein